MVAHFNKLSENISFIFYSYYYGCGVRSLTGHSRILIPDKEWDLLGAHFGSEKESLKGLKLTFRQYPAIHTNYILSHCTTLQYNHNKKII